MLLKIAFTELEMIAFLTRRGYQVIEKEMVIPQHLHGSKFIDQNRTEWIATNEEVSERLQTAFEYEIKRKILNE